MGVGVGMSLATHDSFGVAKALSSRPWLVDCRTAPSEFTAKHYHSACGQHAYAVQILDDKWGDEDEDMDSVFDGLESSLLMVVAPSLSLFPFPSPFDVFPDG